MARPCLFNSVKFKTLIRELGIPKPYVVGLLEVMWACANEMGNPVLGAPKDVESAAEWPGEKNVFFEALSVDGWIDKTESGEWEIHDFWDHAPDYVRRRRVREIEREKRGETLAGLRSKAGKKSGESRRKQAEDDEKNEDNPKNHNEQTSTSDEQTSTMCSQKRTSGEQTSTNVPTPTPAPTPNNKRTVCFDKTTESFDVFWRAWPTHPRKRDKQTALKRWKTACAAHGSETVAKSTMAVLPQWLNCEEWTKQNREFMPMPSSWINAGNWQQLPGGEEVNLDGNGKQKLPEEPKQETISERHAREDAEERARIDSLSAED